MRIPLQIIYEGSPKAVAGDTELVCAQCGETFPDGITYDLPDFAKFGIHHPGCGGGVHLRSIEPSPDAPDEIAIGDSQQKTVHVVVRSWECGPVQVIGAYRDEASAADRVRRLKARSTSWKYDCWEVPLW